MKTTNDMNRPVRIKLRVGIHHDGADYVPGDVLEVPAYQAIAYVHQNRGDILDETPKVPPLTKGSLVQDDPNGTHGDPATKGTKPPAAKTPKPAGTKKKDEA